MHLKSLKRFGIGYSCQPQWMRLGLMAGSRVWRRCDETRSGIDVYKEHNIVPIDDGAVEYVPVDRRERIKKVYTSSFLSF